MIEAECKNAIGDIGIVLAWTEGVQDYDAVQS